MQERAGLLQHQLAAFLSGQLAGDEAVSSTRKGELLKQVQNFLISTQQVGQGTKHDAQEWEWVEHARVLTPLEVIVSVANEVTQRRIG